LPKKKLIPEELQKHLANAGYGSIALIGCRSTGRFHPCCEFDVLADVKDNTVRHEVFDSKFVDIIPIPNKPNESDLFNALQMKVVSDSALLFAALQRDERKVVEDYALSRLLESISAIKKAESCNMEKNFVDASFWLSSAGYGLGDAAVSMHVMSVHPAHLLDDTREAFMQIGAPQETFFEAINLQSASRTSVERRLEGLNQIMLSSLQIQEGSPESIYVYSKQLNQKVSWLLKNHAVLQAQTFLGYHAIRMLKMIYGRFCKEMGIPEHHNRVVAELLERGERPYRISQGSFRLLGLQSGVSSMVSTVKNLRSLAEAVRRNIAAKG
jgi:hypothetical protein